MRAEKAERKAYGTFILSADWRPRPAPASPQLVCHTHPWRLSPGAGVIPNPVYEELTGVNSGPLWLWGPKGRKGRVHSMLFSLWTYSS